jgi:chloramphenicol 3-O phosphotransferase
MSDQPSRRDRPGDTASPGKIILLNGPSSVGKSTIARVLQARLDEPFWHVSIDHFRDAGMLPLDRIRDGGFDWAVMRPAFFDGFHRCLPALAGAGNNLIVEHIVETRAWMDRLVELLAPFDVFFVGLHCPLPELERREAERGDRRIGESRSDFAVVHGFGVYDLELDASLPPEGNASTLVSAWAARTRPGSLRPMGARE